MKKLTIKLLSIAGLLIVGFTATAQVTYNALPATVLSVPAPTTPDTNIIGAVPAGWGNAIKADIAYMEGVSLTNGRVQVEAGALVGRTSHKVGGFVNVMFPIGDGTNFVFGPGLGLAYFDGNVYNATLNAHLGAPFSLPLVKLPLYYYVESGGGWNISKNEPMAQAFTGLNYVHKFSNNSAFTFGVAIGTVSDIPETLIGIGGSYTWKF